MTKLGSSTQKNPRATDKRWLVGLPIALLIGASLWFLNGQSVPKTTPSSEIKSEATPKTTAEIEQEKIEANARYERALALFQKAEAEHKASKIKSAFKLYDRASVEGDPQINAILIGRYMRAQDGFDYDFEKAETIIRTLPNDTQGLYLARLANQYETGRRGLTPDVARAARLLEDAVKMGYGTAYMVLYNLYSNPAYRAPFYDPEKAYDYIDQAIAQTNDAPPRIVKAKRLFAQNDTASRTQALPLLEDVLKIERRNIHAIEMLGEYYYTRDQKGDRKKAIKLYNRLPTPSPIIIYRQAEVLRASARTKGDWAQLRETYVIPATSRHIPSMFMMGHIHRLGLADEADLDVALSYYEAIPTPLGNPAGHFMGAIYQSGEWPKKGSKPNYGKAIAAYKLGIEARVPAAKAMMARLYEGGLGVPKDEAQAFAMMKEAADDGSNLGRAGMADYFERGIGTTRDRAAARNWKRLIEPHKNPRTFICDLCDPETE